MTRVWFKPDRRIGVSLGWDGLTWWYAQKSANGGVWSDSGHFGCGGFYRFRQAVRAYWGKG